VTSQASSLCGVMPITVDYTNGVRVCKGFSRLGLEISGGLECLSSGNILSFAIIRSGSIGRLKAAHSADGREFHPDAIFEMDSRSADLASAHHVLHSVVHRGRQSPGGGGTSCRDFRESLAAGRREMPGPASEEPKFDFLREALGTFGKRGLS